MSQVTRFSDNLIFTGVSPTSNISMTMNTLTVNGNLRVIGTTTNVAATNTQITDPVITLNQGATTAGVVYPYNGRNASGIEVNRGTSPTVSIIWNEDTGSWQLTSDGSTYINIATGAMGITSVSADPAPQLGGNLDVLSRTIFSSNNTVIKHDTNVAIQNTTVAPSTLSGYNIVYAQTPGGGGSGLYTTNTTNQQQELATKSAAIKYSIIFG